MMILKLVGFGMLWVEVFASNLPRCIYNNSCSNQINGGHIYKYFLHRIRLITTQIIGIHECIEISILKLMSNNIYIYAQVHIVIQ